MLNYICGEWTHRQQDTCCSLFSVLKSGAGGRHQGLPSPPQHPSSQGLALPCSGLCRQLDSSHRSLFQFAPKQLSSNTFFPPFFLLYGRIVVCPSMFAKTPENSSCDQLLWKTRNMDYNALTDCYKIYFPTTSSNLRWLFPMGLFLKLMQWLWVFKTNTNFASSWTNSMSNQYILQRDLKCLFSVYL